MCRSALVAVLAIAAASALPAHAQEAEPDPRISTVARARELGPGATVRVVGVVSVPPGVFDGGFAIQDGTGGIWVLPPPDVLRLRLGQRVGVQGTLDNLNGQLAIQPMAIGEMGDRDAPTPRIVRTGALGEEDEGWLVRVRGRVTGEVVDDAPWGWKVMVDDGSGPVMVFVDTESNVDVSPLRPGHRVEVTGFAGQYEDHYEVVPRAQFDIRVLTPEPGASALTRN